MDDVTNDMLTPERIAAVEARAFSDLAALKGSPIYESAETVLALINAFNRQARTVRPCLCCRQMQPCQDGCRCKDGAA